MPDYALPDQYGNISNLADGAVYISSQVPIFVPLLLIFIFLTIMLSGFFNEERRSGKSNIFMWASIAGLVTTTGAFVLYLIPGMMNIEVLSLCVVVTIVCAMVFFFKRE